MQESVRPADPAEFGRFALPGPVEALRRLADRLPQGRLGLWGVSIIRRLCLAGRTAPFDVALFGSQRARLHPHDNRCEKRVFAGAHLWDGAERRHLNAMIAAGSGPFVFVDAGANVGLYTLSVRAACLAAGRALRAVAVEPDPDTLTRLRCNIELSGADEVTVVPAALADQAGTVSLAAAGANRGEVRVDAGGTVEVAAQPLADVLGAAGVTRIDALKIDIEGMEAAVLGSFFATAPATLHPEVILLETGRSGNAALLAQLAQAGYAPILRTRMNTILGLTRDDASAPGLPGRPGTHLANQGP
ncbi:MAG: FkbM family methyltransferase [Pseudomonadota bacterium]